jgi:hypothetical protein
MITLERLRQEQQFLFVEQICGEQYRKVKV